MNLAEFLAIILAEFGTYEVGRHILDTIDLGRMAKKWSYEYGRQYLHAIELGRQLIPYFSWQTSDKWVIILADNW